MKHPLAATRRRFLRTTIAATAGITVAPNILRAQNGPEPLRVAAIGVNGKGSSDIDEIFKGNVIVGLCDIDSSRAVQKREQHPDAKFFYDFREMLDTMKDQIDVVTVSTPDHSHFPAALMAMQLGKPLMCQKPLTNNIWEARVLGNFARKHNILTVMGNQGATYEGTRRIKEIIEAGVIGDVTEVHAFTNRPIWPQGKNVPTPAEPVPDHIKWDLFLAQVAKDWEYSPTIHPFKWRGFWDFGSGAIGDIACHALHAAYWALDLGGDCTVEASNVSEFDEKSFPVRSVLTFHFPAKGSRAALKLVWQDGIKDANENPDFIRPPGLPDGFKFSQGDQIFIGTEGTMVCADIYGGAAPQLYPETLTEKARAVPRKFDRVRGGPTQELCAAIRGTGPKPVSSFDGTAAGLTEMALTGNLAIKYNRKIDWDSQALGVRGFPEADAMIKRVYRSGWEAKDLG